MTYPPGYNLKVNQNYQVLKHLWPYRHERINRIAVRECFKWIRLDIAEHIRWKNKI